jgi:hypothetical protein
MKAWAIVCMLGAAACGNDTATARPDAGGGEPCLDVTSDPLNCGACGRTCVISNATAGCESGECVIASCAPGRADGDGDVVNGCEAEAECGARTLVPVHRAIGDGHLYTTDLAAASTAPFQVESQNYFRLASAPGPGLVQAYLCRKGNGRFFVTSSPTCEGAGPVVLSLGHWFTREVCGSIPLFRLSHPGPPDNHFYTLSAPERDRADNDLGYTSEGIAGYVFPRM